MVVAYFLLGGLASLPVLAAFHAQQGAAGTGVLTATIVADSVTILALVGWLSWRHPDWRREMGVAFDRDIGREVAVGIASGAVISVIAAILLRTILEPVFHVLFGHAVRTPPQVASGLSVGGKVSFVIAGVVVAPIMEELFFRGCLFRAIRDRKGFLLGAIVSSVVFGMFHILSAAIRDLLLLQTGLALVGFGFAVVYERRGKLAACVAAHATFNLLAVLSILATTR